MSKMVQRTTEGAPPTPEPTCTVPRRCGLPSPRGQGGGVDAGSGVVARSGVCLDFRISTLGVDGTVRCADWLRGQRDCRHADAPSGPAPRRLGARRAAHDVERHLVHRSRRHTRRGQNDFYDVVGPGVRGGGLGSMLDPAPGRRTRRGGPWETPSTRLREQIIGRWDDLSVSTRAEAGISQGETYAPNGRYAYASVIWADGESGFLTRGFTGDGRYVVEGNRLTIYPDRGAPQTRLIHIVEDREATVPPRSTKTLQDQRWYD